MHLRIRFIALALTAAFTSIAAAGPATRPAGPFPYQANSPRAALKAFSDSMPAGGLKAALDVYHFTNDAEKALAESLARGDVAESRLEKYVRAQFNADAVEDIDHAMRAHSDKNLDNATETIDGNKATVHWSDGDELDMIRVNGVWKISVASLVDEKVTAADFAKTNNEVADAMEQLAARAEHGEYANPFLLARAIKQRMFRILGEEDTEP